MRIERFVVVEDAGILIDPTIADGQVHGGIAQGIANALLEEVVYDRKPATSSPPRSPISAADGEARFAKIEISDLETPNRRHDHRGEGPR